MNFFKDPMMSLAIFTVFIIIGCSIVFESQAQPVPPFPVNLEVEGVCHRKVKVTEPVDVHTHCHRNIYKQENENGQADWMLIPPGCVSVHLHLTREEIVVFQDKKCYILFINDPKPLEVVS